MNIAIKLPNNLTELIYSFPFLHKLNDLFKGTDFNLHLITGALEIEVLNLLPFKAFFHQLDKKDSESSFRVLRAYKNSKLNMQSYEYYLCLTNLKSDLLLGKLLKAKESIVFDDIGLSVLKAKKVQRLSGRKKVEQYFKLLSELDEIDENEIKSIASRDFEVDKELDDYIVIDSEILKSDDWLDFLELFDETRIIILGEKTNTYSKYKSIEDRNYIDIAKLLYLSKAFITSSYEKSLLCSYTGAMTFYLKENKSEITSFEFFMSKVFEINLQDNTDGDSYNYGAIFDLIYEKLPSVVKDKK